jgi:hypothetical protein
MLNLRTMLPALALAAIFATTSDVSAQGPKAITHPALTQFDYVSGLGVYVVPGMRDKTGLVVIDVEDGSRAQALGIQPQELIYRSTRNYTWGGPFRTATPTTADLQFAADRRFAPGWISTTYRVTYGQNSAGRWTYTER